MTSEHEGDPREIDTADIEAEALNVRAGSSRMKWVAMVLALVTVGAIAFSVTSFVGARETAEKGERQADATSQVVGNQATEQSDRILAICKDGTDEAKKLDEAGLCGTATETKDLVEKKIPATASGRDGVDGRDASIAQVSLVTSRLLPAAVAAYCDRNGECQGKPGTNGSDGDDVTPEALAAAVRGQAPPLLAAFCAANNGCQGPRGEKGESVKGDPGKPGANGTNGTNGKDSTVPGPPGPAAPVIVSSICNDDAQIVLTFDNDTSIVVADSVCRPALLP